MSNFVSRLVVTIIGLPVVLGAVWLGGWWLFALVAAAALVGLHEFYSMARPLRPLVLAGYGGVALTLVGARLGGIEWMLGGFLATFLLAFLLYLVASTRAPATVAVERDRARRVVDRLRARLPAAAARHCRSTGDSSRSPC